MEDNVFYKYYVIEFTKLLPYKNIDKYICIPDSWIRLRDETTQSVVIKYPTEGEAQTERRVEMGENFSIEWSIYEANVKYGTDSYSDAKDYINTLNIIQERRCRKLSEDKNSLKSKNKPRKIKKLNYITKKPETTVYPLDCAKEITAPNLMISRQVALANSNTETRDKAEDNGTVYFTRQARRLSLSSRLNSIDQNTLTREKSFEKSAELEENVPSTAIKENDNNKSMDLDNESNVNNCTLDLNNESLNPRIRPPFIGPGFSAQLKEMHSHFEKTHLMLDRMRLAYIQKCLVLQEIIKLVDNFDNMFPLSTSENATTVEEEKKDEARDKGGEGEKDKPKTRVQKRKDAVRDESRSFHCDEIDPETDMDVEDRPKGIPTKLRGRARSFTLPPEYDEYDSRWTLRYREKADGLVELMPQTNIYVKDLILRNCIRLSKNSQTLARMLFLEIFTENALKTCTLNGKPANAHTTSESKTRPGLDTNAKTALFNFVEKHASRVNWPKTHTLTILTTLRNKIQDIRSK